jgi:hypothetical protein
MCVLHSTSTYTFVVNMKDFACVWHATSLRDLAAQGMKGHVGMEASGHARWFELRVLGLASGV